LTTGPLQPSVPAILGGKYRRGEVLGKGGMGAVFRGEHVLTGRGVALKLLHAEHAQSEDIGRRFLREARTAASLKHPHIIDVLDLGQEGDAVYMVLELLEGESLAALLHRAKSLPVARAAEVLLPVMRAVAMAHERQVIHRDATGAEVPKVLDFGTAKALGEEPEARVTKTGFVLGTPAYMSPEQAEGIPENIGPGTDVWSMGVVWYEALTGELPFQGASHTAMILAVAQGKFQRLTRRAPHVPVALATAIDKALVKDRGRRYAHLGEFLLAIEQALAAPPQAPSLGPDGRPPPPPPSAPSVADGRHHDTIESPPTRPEGAALDTLPSARLLPQSPPTPDPVTARRPSPRRSVGVAIGIGLAVAAGVAAWLALAHRPAAPIDPPGERPARIAPPAPPPPEPATAAPPIATTDAAAALPPPIAPDRRAPRRDEVRGERPRATEGRHAPAVILAPPPPTPAAPRRAPPPAAHAPMREYEPS